MEQTAIVKRILPSGLAQISLLRQTECGLSCKDCKGCHQSPGEELLALADNSVGAAVGDIVIVSPAAIGGVWLALLMYLLPCVGLILGYLLAAQLGLAQGLCVLFAFFGLFLGFVPAVCKNRAVLRGGKAEFIILSIGR